MPKTIQEYRISLLRSARYQYLNLTVGITIILSLIIPDIKPSEDVCDVTVSSQYVEEREHGTCAQFVMLCQHAKDWKVNLPVSKIIFVPLTFYLIELASSEVATSFKQLLPNVEIIFWSSRPLTNIILNIACTYVQQSVPILQDDNTMLKPLGDSLISSLKCTTKYGVWQTLFISLRNNHMNCDNVIFKVKAVHFFHK